MNILTYINMMFNINEKIDIITKSCNNLFIINVNKDTFDIIIYCYIFFKNNKVNIKIITNFKCYCYIDTNIDNEYINCINEFNISCIFNEITLDNIIKNINIMTNFYNNSFDQLHNQYNLYNKPNICINKCDINYDKYREVFTNITKEIKYNNRFLTSSKIINLIINDIKYVNNNIKYKHYILIDYDNPYNLTIRLKFDNDTNISKILNKINNKYKYDYIEFEIVLNCSYPYNPPSLLYKKPHITTELFIGLLNINILKLQYWTNIISLDYIITNIANKFEEEYYKYIIIDTYLNNNDISFDVYEYNIIQLSYITKNYNKIINCDIDIILPYNTNNTCVENGTGYSNNINNSDKLYKIENTKKANLLLTILINIHTYINNNITNNYKICNIILSYLLQKLTDITILEIINNIKLYIIIYNILELIIDNKLIEHDILLIISNHINKIYYDIENIILSTKCNNDIIKIYDIMKKYNEIYISNIKKSNIEIDINIDDIKNNYCNIMKPLQFLTYDFDNTHKFFNMINNSLNKSSLIRIVSEISSFKSNLPLHWDSTIWIQFPKNKYNIFTFLISGPKNTPYENGLFEFHAYFSDDYPKSVPKVLLNTTGNGTVRFNPNLYKNGTVCLSLLGTWHGNKDEIWNPLKSTFLQIMVSIQSFILIEEPYFNEPGYIKHIGTDYGTNASNIYNNDIYPNTIEYCMINMINNPPLGYKEIIDNHFKIKKDEIINTLSKWTESCNCSVLEEKIKILKLLLDKY